MEIMTPTRAKRNSKAPERFSSDEIKPDSVLGSVGQIDRPGSASNAKLKPSIRGPLKVKLPKLKRLQLLQSHIIAKESTRSNKSSSGSTPKIKLPTKRKISVPTVLDESSPTTQHGTANSSDEGNESGITKISDLDAFSPQSDDNCSAKDDATTSNLNETKTEIEKAVDEVDSCDRCESTDASQEAQVKITVERKSESTNPSGIRCPCGIEDDLGVMLECERCFTWQHGHCINVGPEEDAYEGYVCAYCTLPPGKHNDSLTNLVVGDRFQSKFEQLENFMTLKSETPGSFPEVADENCVNLTTDELEKAISDLTRVANSLKVKWRILTSEDYNAELKIWKNPIWSDDPQENRKQQQQPVCFVGDVYKGNLRLNICNMLNKMHKRCQLMRFQISFLEKQGQDPQPKLDKLLASLDDISRVVEEYSDNLKQN